MRKSTTALACLGVAAVFGLGTFAGAALPDRKVEFINLGKYAVTAIIPKRTDAAAFDGKNNYLPGTAQLAAYTRKTFDLHDRLPGTAGGAGSCKRDIMFSVAGYGNVVVKDANICNAEQAIFVNPDTTIIVPIK
jgi:hypothetical protein